MTLISMPSTLSSLGGGSTCNHFDSKPSNCSLIPSYISVFHWLVGFTHRQLYRHFVQLSEVYHFEKHVFNLIYVFL